MGPARETPKKVVILDTYRKMKHRKTKPETGRSATLAMDEVTYHLLMAVKALKGSAN